MGKHCYPVIRTKFIEFLDGVWFSMLEIAEEFDMEYASVNYYMTKLRAEGLVTERVNEDDKLTVEFIYLSTGELPEIKEAIRQDHGVLRGAIIRFLTGPGVWFSMQEIADEFEVPYHVARDHMRKLRAEDLITERQMPKRIVEFHYSP